MLQFVFLSQIILSSIMTGIIWIIQLVHYPSFQYIESGEWETFHKFHTSRMGLIVGPLMVLELAGGIYLFYINDAMGFILATNILIWMSTFLIQVPIHHKLSTKYLSEQSKSLTRTNWIRTVLWTLKTIVLLCLIKEVI